MVKNMTAEQGRTKEIVLFGLFTALTAIGAFIRIPVPVCPFTLQLLFTPTFGYLIGFIAGAWVTGRIREITGGKSFGQILLANLSGLLVVYLFGMVYVYIINNFYLGTPIGIWPVVLYCFILAVPGDICLCLLAAVMARRLERAAGDFIR